MNYLKQKLEEKQILKPMTERDLAQRTGIDETTIYKYFNGQRKINKIEHIYLIAKVLDLDLNEFIEEILK